MKSIHKVSAVQYRTQYMNLDPDVNLRDIIKVDQDANYEAFPNAANEVDIDEPLGSQSECAGADEELTDYASAGFDEASTEAMEPVDDVKEVITDDIQQVCLSRCRYCKLVMPRDFMESHLKRSHSDKKKKYGDYGFVRKTFTR